MQWVWFQCFGFGVSGLALGLLGALMAFKALRDLPFVVDNVLSGWF